MGSLPSSSVQVDVFHPRASCVFSLHVCWYVCPRDCRRVLVTVTCSISNRCKLRKILVRSDIIPVQGSQPTCDISHKASTRLLSLSIMGTVIIVPATGHHCR